MIWLLAILSNPAAGAAPVQAVAVAEARVIVIRPHRASAADWSRSRNRHRRELVKIEKEGPVLLRLTEYE